MQPLHSMQRRRRAGRRSRRLGLFVIVFALLVSACTLGTTLPATQLTDTGATVEGTVYSSSNATVSYWFKYGRTTSYGSETPRRSIVISDRDQHPVSEQLTGLTPGTTYRYRICVAQTGTTCGTERTFTTTGQPPFAVTTNPGLYPAFDTVVSDYVTRCGVAPVAVNVSTISGATVAINGGPAQTGNFSQNITLAPGDAFSFTTSLAGSTNTYHVRCLPADFPDWTYNEAGVPSAKFYITTPQGVKAPSGQPAGTYVAIFDDDGVPVWWKASPAAIDAQLLPNGNLAWAHFASVPPPGSGYDEHRLDGTLVRTWSTIGVGTDFHDIQMLPNGNVLLGSYAPRPGTLDLSPYGGPSTNGTIVDGVIQEVTPGGAVVWSWDSKDHIDPAETPARWLPAVTTVPRTLPDGRLAFDYSHWNSVQQVGDTVVMSFRHTDSVYAVDKTDGSIIWKLGGTPTPESLTVIGDPESNPLGGQHFARMLPDGSVTVYDNNTAETAPPRGVRYTIDLANMTATFREAVSDPAVPTSPCCGSSVRLPDRSWLTAWGGYPVISEFGPGRDLHFTLGFIPTNGTFGFSYRVDPIVGTSPSIEDFRAGMDAMP